MSKLLLACAALAATAAALGAQARPPASPAVHIEPIRVQLIYENSGRLSRNIAPPADFALWNTGAGEGDAGQSATAALVSVPVTTTGDGFGHYPPLVVTVTNARGRVIASRTFRQFMFDGGRSVKTLQMQDIACAGRITINAAMGRQHRSTRLDFACGE
jgi:hypothetical protein